MRVFVNELGWLLVILFDDFHDLSIVHAGDAIGIGEDAVVVGDDDHGAVCGAGDFAEKIEHDLAVLRIQRGGGFVTDDEGWFVDQRACNRYALLLAAGKFVRAIFPTIAESDFFENLPRALDGGAVGCALDQQRHADIFRNGKRGDEIELLKDEADVFRTETGERTAGHVFELAVEDVDRAAFNLQGAGNGTEQSGFSTARRTDKHHDFSGSGLETDLLEHVDAIRSVAETFFQRTDIDHDAG